MLYDFILIYLSTFRPYYYNVRLNDISVLNTSIYNKMFCNCNFGFTYFLLSLYGIELIRPMKHPMSDISTVGRVSAPRLGDAVFNPGPGHTKVVNNGTSCSPLGTQMFRVGFNTDKNNFGQIYSI